MRRGDQRKRKPTREDFQRLQRLVALLEQTIRALCGENGIGYFLPVKYLDRLSRVTNIGAGAIGTIVKSKLDDLACFADDDRGAWVFYGGEGNKAEAMAREAINKLIADERPTLPPGFMDKKLKVVRDDDRFN